MYLIPFSRTIRYPQLIGQILPSQLMTCILVMIQYMRINYSINRFNPFIILTMKYATIDLSKLKFNLNQGYSTPKINPNSTINRPNSNISNKCITKTISTFFFPQENMAQKNDERPCQKPFISKSFYAKNRKMIESALRSKKRKSIDMKTNGILQSNLNKTLKAKSTVITKKCFHQFYINKQDNTHRSQLSQQKKKQSLKTNLFRSNFAMKKQRNKKSSLFLHENIPKQNETLQFEYGSIKMAIRLNDESRQKIEHNILQQKCINNIMSRYIKKSSRTTKKTLQKEVKPKINKQDKQNLQFDVAPWNYSQHQDAHF